MKWQADSSPAQLLVEELGHAVERDAVLLYHVIKVDSYRRGSRVPYKNSSQD